MNPSLLIAAGALATVVAGVHGWLGETKVFGAARIEPARAALLMRLGWQCGTVAWIAFGLLLLAAPTVENDRVRDWIIFAAIATFGFGAAGNAYATRGRHPGWMLLTVVCVLALWGR